MHPNLIILLTSFIVTVASINIIWWMVLDKEQRMTFYDWIDKVKERALAKLIRKAV